MKDHDNFIHKYYLPLFWSNNHEDVSSGSEYDSAKLTVRRHENIIFDLLLNKSKIFEWQISLLYYVLNDKKLSSNLAQISEQINSANQKIHSYYQ